MIYTHALRSVLSEVRVHSDIEAKGYKDNHLWLWTFPSALFRREGEKKDGEANLAFWAVS